MWLTQWPGRQGDRVRRLGEMWRRTLLGLLRSDRDQEGFGGLLRLGGSNGCDLGCGELGIRGLGFWRVGIENVGLGGGLHLEGD